MVLATFANADASSDAAIASLTGVLSTGPACITQCLVGAANANSSTPTQTTIAFCTLVMGQNATAQNMFTACLGKSCTGAQQQAAMGLQSNTTFLQLLPVACGSLLTPPAASGSPSAGSIASGSASASAGSSASTGSPSSTSPLATSAAIQVVTSLALSAFVGMAFML
ncbi:hypothetical protein HDU98_008402 [Podochytrium sp. JEL0797]|nr:hypothetical protein HDU98_008402 [Podochytrium sp. JEL0797]